ncbi:hypothetical protein [Nostoc sp.]|uniref:hypothetical protein n=1 Tax=Nostoc sp. TaxID=1180 RepID=UPI002FF98D16
MDFTEINTLVDNAIGFVTGFGTQKQAYEIQLASKDERIADLESQLKTAVATGQGNAVEIQTLHDKLTQLATLVNPQPVTPVTAAV